MNVGFYHAGRGDEQTARARIAAMVQSVRLAMPGVSITHFTDLTTRPVAGVDAVVRRDVLLIAMACIDAYAAVDGEWLFIDTDVLVQQDVRKVFERDFDIAVADRRGTLRAQDIGTKAMTAMPFNKGAVFSRSRAFWQAVQVRLNSLSAKRQGWMGDQQAMCDVIASKQFDVLVLPNGYNYPPHRHDDDVSDKAICHYKGRDRKAWMLDRCAA